MIQLKMNPYNDKEKKALLKLLTNASTTLSVVYCELDDCVECDYRHLCYDLEKAKQHACRKVQEVSKK